MQMIADGKIKDGTKLNKITGNEVYQYEYRNGSLYYSNSNITSMYKLNVILNLDFEILEDTTEEIEEIEEIDWYEINGVGEQHDEYRLVNGDKYICGAYNDAEMVMIRKINELVRAYNKSNNNTTYKAENCMTD